MNEVMKQEQETTLRDKELDKVNDLLRSALMDLSHLLVFAEVDADDYEILIWVWESIVESAGIILSHRHPRACATSSTSDPHCDHSSDREGKR